MSDLKKKKSSQITSNNAKSQTNKLTSLEQVFAQSRQLAWQVLDAESLIYSQTDVNIEKITQLTSLYMRIIQKLNCLQDPREQYFSYKMQKLMSEPYIIRCFNNQHQPKRSALQDRRKILEQKIEQEAERQNHKKIVQKTLQSQTEKEIRVRSKIQNAIDEEDKKLEERIRRRALNRLERSIQFSPSSLQFLNTSNDQGSATSSNGSKRRIPQSKSSDFQLQMSQDQRFTELKKQLEEEQRQQRIARKAFGNRRINRKQ